MSAPVRPVLLDWAVQSKLPGDLEDYRVLACGAGLEHWRHYESILREVNPGNPVHQKRDAPDSLPRVVIGEYSVAEGSTARAVAVREFTEERDGFKRQISRTTLYLLPAFDEDEGRISLRGLVNELTDARRPSSRAQRDGEPVEADVPLWPRTDAAQQRLAVDFEWLVWAAAATLDGPVVITGARLSWRERLDVFDAVLSLLPSAVRSQVWVGTWSDPATPSRLRLAFGRKAGSGARELRWGRNPDPAAFPPGVRGLADHLVALAGRLPDGENRIVESFDAMIRAMPLDALDEVLIETRGALRQLDLLQHAWQALQTGTADLATVRDALNANPPDRMREQDLPRIRDLIDALLFAFGDDGPPALVASAHWLPLGLARSIDAALLAFDAADDQEPAVVGPEAERMWSAVRQTPYADQFMRDLLEAVLEQENPAGLLRQYVSVWAAVADDILVMSLPLTRACILRNPRVVRVLLSVSDSSGGTGQWIRDWLLWLDCVADDAPPWLRAYGAVLLEPDDPGFNGAIAAIAQLAPEQQLPLLLIARWAGAMDKVLPQVWPVVLDAVDALLREYSSHDPSHPPTLSDGLGNRIRRIFLDELPAHSELSGVSLAQIDIVRALFTVPLMPWPAASSQEHCDGYAAVLQREFARSHLAERSTALAGVFAQNALDRIWVATDISLGVLRSLADFTDGSAAAVAQALTQRPETMAKLLAERLLDEHWWWRIEYVRPELGRGISLGRLAAAVRDRYPLEELAALSTDAMAQGCTLLDVLSELRPLAQSDEFDKATMLLDRLSTPTAGSTLSEGVLLVVEQVWGAHAAYSIHAEHARRIKRRQAELDAEQARLRRDAQLLDEAQKRGKRLPITERKAVDQPAAPDRGQSGPRPQQPPGAAEFFPVPNPAAGNGPWPAVGYGHAGGVDYERLPPHCAGPLAGSHKAPRELPAGISLFRIFLNFIHLGRRDGNR